MKRLTTLVLCLPLVFSLFGFNPKAEASETSEKDEIRQYLETNVALLRHTFDNLPKQSTKDQIDRAIEEHYKKYPTPQRIKNTSLNELDVFPELEEKYKKLKDQDIKLQYSTDEELNKMDILEKVYTFKKDNSTVRVFLGDIGDIEVMEHTSTPDNSTSKDASTQAVTNMEKNTATAYAVLGGARVYNVWAEGKFEYNKKKKTVKVVHKDGDYRKFIAGSLLSIEEKKMGASRVADQGNYVYREVYTRIYVEAILGFKFGGVVFNSGLAEVYVGAGSNGATYGGQKKL
ncbi:hypothetical protein NSS92_19045 [Bacillus sp. FSL M8-0166]|uniref:hypothetical protein n=1 Tax=Bacillus TaxID=1386 RepID=UPI0010722B06|nr:hypothetical protein [Bacillus safensis]MCU0155671.1 hypothetical protein [Bacillus safensis]TFV09044.1 hypothetical protein E4T85_13620 [Bacillus stratosphericus]